MLKKLKSLRAKLFIWYLLSLFLITVFFYIGVHIYAVAHSDHAFLGLLLLLGVSGFWLIYRITNSISKFTDRIKSISTKNLEERVPVESDDEIGELSRSFNELLGRVEEGFKREKQFIADMAHEFKTPLTTTKSDFEITLGKERSVDEYKKALRDGITDIDKISTTLNKVIELARSNILIGEQPTKFCVSDLCAELIEALSKVAETKNVTIQENLEHMLYMMGYKDRLATALINIIDNALSYTPAGGEVKISVTHKENQIVITIQDTGIGIPKGEIKHVFERFYRSSKTKKMSGSGLGLAISQSIIHAHKGTVFVNSIEDKGTTFTVQLPLLHHQS